MSVARAVVLAVCLLTGGCTVLEQHDIQIEQSGPITQGVDSPLALPNASVFRIPIRTTPDLRAYGLRTGFNIVVGMSLCSKGEFDPARPLQNETYVRDANGPVGLQSAPSAPSPTYFLTARVRAVPLSGQNIQWYDLAQMPQDICVILQGGEMLSGSFRSNTLVIPAAAVADALRAAP